MNDFNDNFSASITKTTTTITETRDLTNNFTATTTTLNPVSGLGVDDLLGGLHVDGTDDTTSTTDNLLGVMDLSGIPDPEVEIEGSGQYGHQNV